MKIGFCAKPDQAPVVAAAGFDYIEPPVNYIAGLTEEAFTACLDELRKACVPAPSFNLLFPKTMLLLAVATSIDALAAGVSFAFIGVRIVETILVIGAVTFFLSLLGVLLGSLIGRRFRMGAQIAGGVILILLGLRILLADLLHI
jgi:putative Mn2+ efflux pump MntP